MATLVAKMQVVVKKYEKEVKETEIKLEELNARKAALPPKKDLRPAEQIALENQHQELADEVDRMGKTLSAITRTCRKRRELFEEALGRPVTLEHPDLESLKLELGIKHGELKRITAALREKYPGFESFPDFENDGCAIECLNEALDDSKYKLQEAKRLVEVLQQWPKYQALAQEEFGFTTQQLKIYDPIAIANMCKQWAT